MIFKWGVECFDNLTFGQRIYALAVIGNGLLRKDIPLVRLTAVLEGTIAAIFEYLERSILRLLRANGTVMTSDLSC